MVDRTAVFGFGVWSVLLAAAAAADRPVITGINWAPADTIVSTAKGSDNWPLTWADDDRLYTTYGDGYGFEPAVPLKLSMGFAQISGGPDAFSGANIYPTNADQRGDGKRGRKASGMLSVSGVLYLWMRNAAADATGTKSTLAWSDDHGGNWRFVPWIIDELGHPCFVNYGKDYAGARDDYVYSLSPNTPSAYNETDDVVLMRVPKSLITNRTAYAFVSGIDRDGNPTWTADISQRASVFHLAGGCNRLDVTYNAPLGRYMMTMRSRAQAGGLDQFSLYEAPEPWGPWTQFFQTDKWDVDPGESAHFPSKWISADGRTVYLVFSGDDSFRVRRGTLIIDAP